MFEVVNPIIIGTFKIKYNTTSAMDAAKMFWNEMSKIVVNEMPKTYFTLRDKNGKLFHFKVSEKKNGKNMVDYMISPIDNIDKKSSDIIVKAFDKITLQSGGNIKEDDDSSTSSSSSVDDVVDKFKKINARRLKSPIVYYHYIPSVYKTENLYVPVFIYPIVPYLEIGFSTAFWG